MNPALLALAVHDIKNALGILEGDLATMTQQPCAGLAERAYRQCAQLRQRLVAFLTLYACGGSLSAHPADESPEEFLAGLLHVAIRPDDAPLRIGPCRSVPAFWYFDEQLLRMALEAGLHNAWRFARTDVVLDARVSDGFLIFRIDDDGPGLRGQDPTALTSTGLGTELCEAVARAHRAGGRCGHVTLQDRPEGGCRFELWIP
jgi:signal transduction histidine kinase